MPFSKILIAIDDTPESMKTARYGFNLAHALQAAIALVCVVDKDKEVVNADLGITPNESEHVMREEAEKIIEQYVHMFDGKGEVYRFTPAGVPEREILGYSEQWQADLIVMGAHTHSKLNRMLSSSTAERVISEATIPVLVTPTHMK